MKKIIYLLFFFSANCFSGDVISNKYKYYECNENADLKSCTNGCTPTKDFLVQFKYNTTGNKVSLIGYSRGVITGTVNFENCTFIDSRNWVCNQHSYDSYNNEYQRGSIALDSSQSMTNGVFNMRNHNSFSGWDRKLNTEKTFFCAKEEGFFK
jgi:hypothetical protein